MNSYLEACLLRSLLDEPWGEHLARSREARSNYFTHLKALCFLDFSDDAIDEYQSTLDPSERFEDIKEFRRYLGTEVLRRMSWILEQLGGKL